MIAAASRSNLLILGPNSPKPFVRRAICTDAGDFVFPLWWILAGRLKGAFVIDGEFTISEVTHASVLGLVSRQYLSDTWPAYMFLLLVTSLTLSIPVRVKLSTRLVEKSDLEKIRSHVVRWLRMNPGAYVHCAAARLEKKIQRAKTVAAIGDSLMNG